MKTTTKKITDFANSDYGSEQEKTFLDSTMQAYYNEKTKRNYSEILEEQFNVSQAGKPDFTSDSGSKRKWSYVIAGLLVVLGILSILLINNFNNRTSGNDVQLQYASYMDSKIEMEGATRGEVVEADEAIIAMGEAYESDQYETVVEVAEQLDNIESLDDSSKAQLAFSFGAIGKVDESSSLFESLLLTSSASMQQEIRWTLINLYLENNMKDKAESVFRQMKSNDYKYGESQSLLK